MKNYKIILISVLLFILCLNFVLASDYTMDYKGYSGSEMLSKTFGYRDSNNFIYWTLGASARMYYSLPNSTSYITYKYVGIDDARALGGSSYYSNDVIMHRGTGRFYRSPVTGSAISTITDMSATFPNIEYGGVTDNYLFVLNNANNKIVRFVISDLTSYVTLERTEALNKIIGIDSYYDSENSIWYYVLLTSNSDESEINLIWYDEEGTYKKTDTITGTTFSGANIYSYDTGFIINRQDKNFQIFTSVNNVVNTRNGGYYVYTSSTDLEPPQTEQNFIKETLVYGIQEQEITVSNNQYVNIMKGTFNFTENFTGYAKVTLNSYNTLPNSKLTCRILINDETYNSTITRTDNNINSYGSWELLTDEINGLSGVYVSELECKADSGSFIISNGVGTLHFLNNIPYLFNSGSYESVAGSYTKLELGNILIPNEEAYEENEYLIIYDSVSNVYYKSNDNANIIIEIDGVNTTTLTRTGTTGSFGVFPKIYNKNITGFNRNVTINAYVEGDFNATYKVYAKLLLLPKTETGRQEINVLNITNTEYTTITTLSYYSMDNLTNVITELSSSLRSLQTSVDVIDLRFKLDGQTGTPIYRTVRTTTNKGIISLQNIFTNIETGYYNVTLEAKSLNGHVELSSISISLYSSETIDFLFSGFNISVYDSETLQNINNFTITTEEGVKVSTTNGVISLTTDKTILDFILESEGYYNKTIYNHDVLINGNYSLNKIVYFNPTINGVCNEQITLGFYNSVSKIINVTYNEEPPINETVYISGYKNVLQKVNMYNQKVTNITNSYNYTFNFLDWSTGYYNITTYHNILNVEQEKISTCNFNICKNEWVRTPTACYNEIRVINYTDNNNCNEQYFPSDYGEYEYCTKTEDERKDFWLYFIGCIIIFLIASIIGYTMKNIYISLLGSATLIIFGVLFIQQYSLISIFTALLGVVSTFLTFNFNK